MGKVTMKCEGVYVSQDEQERIMEELLQESRVYATDNADGMMDGYVVTNNTDCEGEMDGSGGSEAEADVMDTDGVMGGITVGKARVQGGLPVRKLTMFLPMKKVPTATAQEKGYRVIPNGYGTVNGVRKPRFRVVTFDKPAAADAKAQLMGALAEGLKKWYEKWRWAYGDRTVHGMGVDADGWGNTRPGQDRSQNGSNEVREGGAGKDGAEGVADQAVGSMSDQVGSGVADRGSAGGGFTPGRDLIFAKGLPLSLTVKWCFENEAVVRGRIPDGTPRVTKPDTDNLQKGLKDCMTRLNVWGDDAQVTEEHVGKYWSKVPGIYVGVEVIGGNEC